MDVVVTLFPNDGLLDPINARSQRINTALPLQAVANFCHEVCNGFCETPARLFFLEGSEVQNPRSLRHGDVVVVSSGEPFCEINYSVKVAPDFQGNARLENRIREAELSVQRPHTRSPYSNDSPPMEMGPMIVNALQHIYPAPIELAREVAQAVNDISIAHNTCSMLEKQALGNPVLDNIFNSLGLLTVNLASAFGEPVQLLRGATKSMSLAQDHSVQPGPLNNRIFGEQSVGLDTNTNFLADDSGGVGCSRPAFTKPPLQSQKSGQSLAATLSSSSLSGFSNSSFGNQDTRLGLYGTNADMGMQQAKPQNMHGFQNNIGAGVGFWGQGNNMYPNRPGLRPITPSLPHMQGGGSRDSPSQNTLPADAISPASTLSSNQTPTINHSDSLRRSDSTHGAQPKTHSGSLSGSQTKPQTRNDESDGSQVVSKDKTPVDGSESLSAERKRSNVGSGSDGGDAIRYDSPVVASSEDQDAKKKRKRSDANRPMSTNHRARFPSHKMIEQRSREKLKSRIYELCLSIPSLKEAKNPTKATIIQKAKEFVESVNETQDALIRQNMAKDERLQQLEREKAALRQEKEELMRQVGTAAVSTVEVTDANNRYIFVDHMWEIIMGYTRQEVVGQKTHDTVLCVSCPFMRIRSEEINYRLNRGQDWSGVILGVRKDGRSFACQASISSVVVNGQVVQYVTTRKNFHMLSNEETAIMCESGPAGFSSASTVNLRNTLMMGP